MSCAPPFQIPNVCLDPNLQFERVTLDDLAPHGRKARKHSKEQLAMLEALIREVGFIVPIIIDNDGKVLAGHARLEVARRLRMTEVPAISASHLSEAQKRAFVIADNRLPKLAAWDTETLKSEYIELANLNLDFDLTITGFSAAEIDAIISFDEPDADSAIPEPPEAPVTQEGDEWILGDHRVLCGDATSETELAKLVGGQTVRACFTDPPYNVPVKGHVTGNASHGEFVMASGEMSETEFEAFLEKTCAQVAKALMPGGVAYVCIDWRSAAKLQAAGERNSLDLINLVVWDKKTGGMGSFYRSRHELILLFRKKGDKHLNNVALGRNGRDRANVWTYEGVNGFGKAKAATRAMHPTVKPLAMVRDALLDCSAKDEIILDLFGGSGTTLIAAEMCGRRARLMELDPKYVDVIVRRFEDFSGKPARLASSGQTFAEVRSERQALLAEEA